MDHFPISHILQLRRIYICHYQNSTSRIFFVYSKYQFYIHMA